ncbi:MAG: histidine phosphatase family protein [Trueperaceae bacterium]|nr:histidine phosphatase family protein [Trueperaceae bacterium]
MGHLILIRHGVTSWNVSGRFQGHSDVPLSDEGRVQARALAGRLRDLGPFDAVYSSPLRRAHETATLALPEGAPEVRLEPRLKELHFGSFEGFTLAENQRHAAWDGWFDDPFGRATPQGESYQQLRDRAVDWLGSLDRSATTLAFAHSGTIQMLLSHVIGVERPSWRKRFFLRHTSLTHVVFEGEDAIVERVNDARHIEQPSVGLYGTRPTESLSQ